jgi:hypothetical protein
MKTAIMTFLIFDLRFLIGQADCGFAARRRKVPARRGCYPKTAAANGCARGTVLPDGQQGDFMRQEKRIRGNTRTLRRSRMRDGKELDLHPRIAGYCRILPRSGTWGNSEREIRSAECRIGHRSGNDPTNPSHYEGGDAAPPYRGVFRPISQSERFGFSPVTANPGENFSRRVGIRINAKAQRRRGADAKGGGRFRDSSPRLLQFQRAHRGTRGKPGG